MSIVNANDIDGEHSYYRILRILRGFLGSVFSYHARARAHGTMVRSPYNGHYRSTGRPKVPDQDVTESLQASCDNRVNGAGETLAGSCP